jgi:hypothetical protein
MAHYGDQIRPIFRTLIDRGGVQNINPKGRYFERAIGRALLSQWESKEPLPASSRPEKEDKG